jgi:alcohol dehydrogenase YqhD (iron-dependent ADH family)
MLDFTYAVSTRVLFGKGTITHLSEEIEKYADRILFVYGGGSIKKIGVYDTVINLLDKSDIEWVELPGVQPNPRIDSVRKGIQLCKDHHLDFILGVGGGSVIDCAKTIAAGMFYEGDPWDLFLLGDSTIRDALPLGTILTFTGTGSEMNGNAVISNTETKEKLAIHHDLLRPRFSILDPTYTFTLPKEQTAAGTVDIFSHVLEQYFSPTADAYLQDRLSESILKTCIRYGPSALKEPTNYTARAQLMWASSLALNGLLGYGKITDWATHGIEHALSALYDVTHGVGLAILTPFWMEYVLDVDTMYKFVEYAQNIWFVTGKDDQDTARKGIEKTQEFFVSLGMPRRLRDVGVDEKKLVEMAEKTVHYHSVGKFKKLEKNDVLTILKNAY